MPDNRFIKEIKLELENIEKIVLELVKILKEYEHKSPNLIYKTAAASFLAQYYNGLKIFLKE